MSDRTTSPTLLVKLRGNDKAAWQRFVVLYRPLILYWCDGWHVRGADADDVCQEVFQAVSAGVEQFRRNTPQDSFRAWLRGITRHKLLDLSRKHRRQPGAAGGTDAFERLNQFADTDAPLVEDSSDQITSLYRRALDFVRGEFEERTWQAFWRVTMDGQTPALVAQELGVTPVAIRVAKSRVLSRLREELGD